jgi:HNH endonuclease
VTKLDAETLRKHLAYDPETGVFVWLRPTGPRAKAGDVAGCQNANGYMGIKIKGVLYVASRLAWLYMTGEWPKAMIDHIDTNRQNDRFANLREATRGQNRRNAGVSRHNRLGVKGCYQAASGRYRTGIKHESKSIHIGTFDTLAEAVEAYRTKARELHAEFLHHSQA